MWSHEDDPETHPLWEQQVALERGMMRAGADKFRDHVIEAERRGNMTRIKPVRALLEDWLPQIAGALKGWLKDVELSKGGPKPIAYPLLKDADPFVASLVALRAVLDNIGKDRMALTPLAIEIGRTIEHELQVRLWEAKAPDLFYKYQNDFERAGSTADHQRRVNISRFNALLKDPESEITWRSWAEDEMFRVGVTLLDILVRKTGWFEIRDDPEHHFKAGRNKSPKLVFAVKEGMTEWIGKAFDHAEVSMPVYKPTIIPPKRWEGSRGGGYWTPYVKGPRLIRFKASQESQKDFAADEYDAIEMPGVYEALHHLQETAWRINARVLDVALAAWSRDMAIAGLPRLTEEDLPPRTARMADHMDAVRKARTEGRDRPEPDPETDAEIFAWKRRAIPIYRRNAKRVAHSRSTSTTVLMAKEFRAYDAFYFPHMLDFRGRVYPIPAFLQPQGDDLARGLLEFADGVQLTEESGGGGWVAVALASNWGFDKASFDDRIAWVEEREDLWRRIAADPLANLEWAQTSGPNKVDKPWQVLAAIYDWVDYLDTGYAHVSHLPVMLDGTCNGIQILSAITRDEISGAHVNLTPGDRPRDIYKFVAERLQAKLVRISAAGGEEGAKADFWLDLTGGELPRSLTKRQVMVLPYGGSKDSFFTYTRAWLAENGPDTSEETEEAAELRNKSISFLVLHMWDTVNEVVSGGMRVMKWLQACAKIVAEANQPIYWVTPGGFVVRHFYGVVKERQIKLMLDGVTHNIKVAERTKELSVKEQLQGISPNFIHSLDAACLMDCIRRCRAQGITAFSAIHDAYGTHAGNLWVLFRELREAFVATMSEDVLGEFRSKCANVLVSLLVTTRHMDELDAVALAEDLLPRPIEPGTLDLSLVRQSDYFFA